MHNSSPHDGYYGNAPLLTLDRPLALVGFFGSNTPQLAHLITQKTGLPISDIERDVEQVFGRRFAELKIKRPGGLERVQRNAVNKAIGRSPPPLILLHPESLRDIVVRENISHKTTSILLIRSPHFIRMRLAEILAEPYRDCGFTHLPSEREIENEIRSLNIKKESFDWVINGEDRPARGLSNEIIDWLNKKA